MLWWSLLSDSVDYTDSDRFILIFAVDIQYLLDNLPIEKHLETFAYVRVTAIFLYYFDKLQRNIFWIKTNIITSLST